MGDDHHHGGQQQQAHARQDERPADPALARDDASDHDAQGGERDQDEADHRRIELCAVFHPLADPVERGVDAEPDQELSEVGALQRAVGRDHPDVNEGAAAASFPQDEADGEEHEQGEQPPDRRRQVGQKQQQAGHRSTKENDARDVEGGDHALAISTRERFVFRDTGERQDDAENAERDVDEKHRAPTERAGQNAAEG